MKYDQIETLINLTPMKMLTQNMTQVSKAIEESYEADDTDQIGELVNSGNSLLNAISKLNEA